MSKEAVQRLRAVPLFSSCNDKEVQFIATQLEEMDFPAGRTLCDEGKSGGDFFIILSGNVEVTRGGKHVPTLKEDDFLGEISLVDNGPRTATVVASSPMRCLVLGPWQFQSVLHQNADIAVRVPYDAKAAPRAGSVRGYEFARRRRATSTPPAD